MKELFLLVGVPGSGKSTVAKRIKDEYETEGIGVEIVSRDEIRFSMVAESDPYFSREHEVFAAFKTAVGDALSNPFVDAVIADATHLSFQSRHKLLNGLDLSNVVLHVYKIECSLHTILKRNALRTGRKRVPRDKVIQMYNSLQNSPKIDEVEFVRYGPLDVTIRFYNNEEEFI